MSRAFIAVDETCPNHPVPELHVNGNALQMTERELVALIEDAQCALGHINGLRRAYWHSLASKYKEETK